MIFKNIIKYTLPIKSINVNKYQTPIYCKEPPLSNISILDKNYSEYFWEQNNKMKSSVFNNQYLPKRKNVENSHKKNKLEK